MGWLSRSFARHRSALTFVVAAAALVVPSATAADVGIAGHASGITVRTGSGDYMITGTWTDSSGTPGTYHGWYHQDTTGYGSCRSTGLGLFLCDDASAFFPFRCNLVSGEVTFRASGGKEITLAIGSGGFAPPSSRIVSGVCQQKADSTMHDTYLLLSNRAAVWPATAEEFSHGFGVLDYALGSMVGVSAPRGNSPVYSDDFALQLGLFSP